MAASVVRKGLPHFTGASFNGRTAFLYSAYIRSIRIAPTIGSVQAALPELFSPFWQSGKTIDGPDRRAHGAHSLGAGPQNPAPDGATPSAPPDGNVTNHAEIVPPVSPQRVTPVSRCIRPRNTRQQEETAGSPERRAFKAMVAGSLPADVSGAVPSRRMTMGVETRLTADQVQCPPLHTLNGRSITRQTHMGQ